MSAPKEVAVGSIVYFWFAANTTAGAAGDGATPLYDVRKSGDAAGDAPTASGTPTLLTHANYTDGLHEIAIDTTGYTAGAEYAVFCTLTISSVNPAGFVGSFIVRAAASTLYEEIVAIKAKTDNLPSAVQKNIALSNFMFLMLDSTDHVTPKTGLAITATRSIDGAAFGACANAASEVTNGWYKINLAATDLNGDVIAIRFTAAGADDRNLTILTKT